MRSRSSRPFVLSDLPPANTVRWTRRYKITVAAAVRFGLITIEEACRNYRMSVEEFHTWQIADHKSMGGGERKAEPMKRRLPPKFMIAISAREMNSRPGSGGFC